MEVGFAVAGALILILTGARALWFAELNRREALRRAAFWRQAAAEAGLTRIESSDDGLRAASGSLQVRLSPYQKDKIGGTCVEITSPWLAPGLTLRPEGEGSFLDSRLPKEIEVGDEDFDKEVSVRGTPALALALLDPDMRRTVRAMLRGRLVVRGHAPLWASGRLKQGVVEGGVLCIDVPEYSSAARPSFGVAYLDGEYKLPAILRAALDFAARLVVPQDLARRIADNQASETEPQVRLLGLLTLLREFPEHAATREAVHAAREDPNAEVRLRVGIALGSEGRSVLLGVARGEGALDATSARAVAALRNSLTLEQTSELLRNALKTRRLTTAKVCLGILGSHSGHHAVEILAKVLLVEKDELAEAAAHALATTGDPSAEAPLLRALSEGPEELRPAAAEALGRVGTRDAVVPLHEAERQPALRGVARQAIAQIHARLAGAAQGQLALAGGEAGRLSIADDESGRLSLSDVGDAAPPGRPQ